MVMFEIAICAEVVLSILFWLLLWEPPKEYNFFEIFDMTTHIFPVLFLFIDFLMQKWIFRFNHFTVILAVGVIYAIVNFTYVKITGKTIYPILPWDDVESYILIFSAIVLLFITFIVLYFITYLNQQKDANDRRYQQMKALILTNQSTNRTSIIKYNTE